jgi:outer membrane protein assembly factor BamB
MKTLLIIGLVFCVISSSYAWNDFSQWRGPNRDGKYPDKNLLKKWPAKGLKLLWQTDHIGIGHTSVAVAKEHVYITGMHKKEGILYCFDVEGNKLWESTYGPEWYKNYPGTRSTPTILGNYLYLMSGTGRLVCFDAKLGKQRWAVDLLKKFNAQNIVWGMAESLLINGDQIICTPGGPSNNIVALNRFNGETVWISKGNGEPSAYCSPLLVEHNSTRMIVTMTAESILGVDADDGSVYWRVPHYQYHKIHADTPLYYDGKIFCLSGSESSSGAVLLELSTNGKKAQQLWQNKKADNLIGGVILHEGYLYSSRYKRDEWFCLDWNTGKIQYVSKDFGGGPIIYADGLFYCYSESGYLGLIKADSRQFEVISSFKVKPGKGPHWAHPVIDKGRLYLRHGESLMVYDIMQK